MSDISKINVDGVDYDVKDSVARNQMSNTVKKGYTERIYSIPNADRLDSILDEMVNNISDLSMDFVLAVCDSDALPLTAGRYFVKVCRTNSNVAIVEFLSYSASSPRHYVRSKYNGTWGSWYYCECTLAE